MQRHYAALAICVVAIAAVAVVAVGRGVSANQPQQAQPPSQPKSKPSPSTSNLPDLEDRLNRSREAVRRYADRLRRELKSALAAGGPKAAIGACATIGPDLDNAVSEETSVEIGRTSLKIRNPENAPDAWEIAALEQFAKQIAAGADAAKLEVFELTVSAEGQKLFRYMKPIMMQEQCLACHGPRIEPDVKSEIVRTYPEDKAVGFNLNELRGAFTLFQLVD